MPTPGDASPALRPVAPAERVEALDVLRGFALLGILLMNIEAFVGPLNAAMTGLNPALTGADRWADALIYLLVQGKFYTLFSLLFGVGFAVMMTRAEAFGRPFTGLYARRLLALAAFGAAHGLLIWSGDILLTYALTGALMLWLFGRMPVSRLPRWGILAYLAPALLTFLFALMFQMAQNDPGKSAELGQQITERAEHWQQTLQAQRQAYGSEGSFAAATAQRADDVAQLLTYIPFWAPAILGMFLIGAWFWRSGVIAEPERHSEVFRRLRFRGFALGLPLVALSFRLLPTVDLYRMDYTSASAGLTMALGNLALCLAYASTLVLALQHPRWKNRVAWLAPAGRMALSNYLIQSLICVGIFYGYGLGYFEQLSRAWQIPFVLAVFGLQVLYSRWWLARFRFGPAEWLWRAATYGHWPPMRA